MNPICITEAQKSAYFKTFDRKRWQFLRAYTDRFKGALMKQVEPVLSELEKGISQAMSQVDIIQEKPIREAYSQLYSQVGAYYASEVFGGLKSAGGYQTKDIEDQFLVFMQSWMETEGVNLVKNVNENTKQQLREILRAGIEKELSVEEMARQIRDSGRIAGIKRARVISRTEIIRASNMGSLQGARSSNLNLAKEWIATRDGRTRIEHTQVDGVTIPTNKEFNVGGESARYPADFQLSAAQSINCRCTLAYVPAERAVQTTEKPNVDVRGFNNNEAFKKFADDLSKSLSIKGKVDVVGKKMNNNLGGSVNFVKQSDGTYKLANNIVIDTSQTIEKQRMLLRHEMRHLYQRDYKGFKVVVDGSKKNQGLYYEDKKVVSISVYNKILKQVNSRNLDVQRKAYNRYISLPWEADAMKFEKIKSKESGGFMYPADLIELPVPYNMV